ncbi:hypothetical protein [Brevibacillus agri]|uniref:hypothetical protein n=1 Tax=Brevibacillus agri TaxID=51101 RepID=UPI001EE52DB3|nr:hypothetical protein [Brevibacillus agri]MCG5252645.1 hypothetical protein [Brevibacillus agri]
MIVGKRIGLTPDDDTRAKLVRLAIACGKHPTTLALDLVRLCVNTPSIIEYVQKINNAEARYKVSYRVRVENGKSTVIYD